MSPECASVIIPAFNEASRIEAVICAARKANLVNNVIVIDDGSTDDTYDIANSSGIVALRHERNRGKGQAMQTGVIQAQKFGTEVLLFLDADLRGITPEHLDILVKPVIEGITPMTIGLLERTKLQNMILMRWGALSGQRALTVSTWESLGRRERQGFNVEAGLNTLARKEGWHRQIQRVKLDNVTHVGKRKKEDTLRKAGIAYAQTYGAAILTYGRLSIGK